MQLCVAAVLLLQLCCSCCTGQFLIGRSIVDITGLASEGAHYGYAKPEQDARGMHTRQYARTFIIGDLTDANQRVVIVVAEFTMSTQSLRDQIVENLAAVYGDLYTYDNVMISGTHSHSTPGGIHTYWMYAAPSGGFINQTFNIYVNGIVEGIRQAHEDLAEGQILYNHGELLNASISRSPYAYDQNPEEEKARYAYNVDKDMYVMKMTRGAEELGMLNMFPVHTTTMKSYNHLISSDNKGYAAQMFERALNPGTLPGQASIVGAFAQSNEGDVTPNIQGDYCINTGEPCSYEKSTCPEDPLNPALCNSLGPTGDIFEDTRIIGGRQSDRALELYAAAIDVISGAVDFRHTWVNMSDIYLGEDEFGPITTCRPAMGYSFAAGATDGPGVKPFTQADTEGDTGIEVVEDVIDEFLNGSEVLQACQYPKPVLLASGEITTPFAWQPEIIPLQLFQIGSIYLVGVPAEFTTMSGRRLTETVRSELEQSGVQGATVILMGIVNSYTSYVTTFEEYQVQRYEGGSTTYGPRTLEAYQLVYTMLATAMATGADVDPGTPPPDMRGAPEETLGVLVNDLVPEGAQAYGEVLIDAEPSYEPGDVVEVVFVAGNPRAAAEAGDNTVPYAEVVRVDAGEQVVYNEASWEVKFYWDSNCHDAQFPGRLNCDEEQKSNATIVWDVPSAQEAGVYKIRHSGYAKTPAGPIEFYSGESQEFQLG